MIDINLCPCHSGNGYEICCKPFHDGTAASNAKALMRSRFAAYSLDLPDYIIKTTDPAAPEYSDDKFSWKRSISHFCRSTLFNDLKILDFKEGEQFATVVFTAYISQSGEDTSFTERSLFRKNKGRWSYILGAIAEGEAPSLIDKKALKLLPMAYYGDSVLEARAEPVKEINDEIKELAEAMIATMQMYNGAGIAAPQVHHSLRLFVVLRADETSEGISWGDPVVMINPVISEYSDETWKANEGCLSIPGYHSDVERPCSITVEYSDLEGGRHKERLSGWSAKAVLHENDHIDGILFIDRIDDKDRAKAAPSLQKLKRRLQSS